MKKLLTFALLALVLGGLAACGSTKKPPNGGDTGPVFNMDGDEFIVMCDNALRCDPRSQQYERLFKAEKIQRITDVEAKYNVKVVYRTYPSQASWGGARERWIIEQTSLGNSPAHVYEISSYQIATLATQQAISPLDAYIDAYGSELFWPEKKAFGHVNGQHYSYDDNFPLADEGIYYNLNLLERYLGAARRNEPSRLWMEGNWDWNAFRTLTNELNDLLNHERLPEDGGPQYVLGGRTYNWAYQFLGANGAHLVTNGLQVGLDSEAAISTLNFMNELYTTPGMWLDNAPLSNASQPEFKDGNIAFHNGQSYWIFVDGKWKDRNFDVGFVPYPTGDNTEADLSNYYINDVYGKAAYVISSAYSKSLVPPGYEDRMIHDEIIFQIWADLQHFPSKDATTGFGSIEESADEFYIKRLLPHYGDELSREAHLSVIDKSYPDYFYSMAEANNHNEAAYMIRLQEAIRGGDIRNRMLSLTVEIQATLSEKFRLPAGFYN